MHVTPEFKRKIEEINSALEIRVANPSDADALARFRNTYYDRKWSASYFLWQFFSSVQQSVLFIALEGDEVVGMNGVQMKLTPQGTCGCIIDSLIHERFRVTGLFYLLEDKAYTYAIENGAQFLVSFANRAAAFARDKRIGWKVIEKIPQLVAPITNILSNIHHLEMIEKNNHQALATAGQYNFFYKDKKWLRWRFFENPVYHYVQKEAGGESYMVSKIFQDPLKNISTCDIVDYFIENDDPIVLCELTKATLSEISMSRVTTCTTWSLSHIPLASYFFALGFKEEAQDRFFCVRILDEKLHHLSSIGAWRLTQADTDVY